MVARVEHLPTLVFVSNCVVLPVPYQHLPMAVVPGQVPGPLRLGVAWLGLGQSQPEAPQLVVDVPARAAEDGGGHALDGNATVSTECCKEALEDHLLVAVPGAGRHVVAAGRGQPKAPVPAGDRILVLPEVIAVGEGVCADRGPEAFRLHGLGGQFRRPSPPLPKESV